MLEKGEMLWYVVHTYSGYENKVKTSLEKTIENLGMHEYIQKVVIPEESVVENKNGVEKVRKRKIFPGYVLIKMAVTDDSWYLVRNTKGVTGFVGTNLKPIPLTPDEVVKMRLEDEQAVIEEVDFEVGDKITITGGPFADREAVITQIFMDKRLVKAQMMMFGKETVMELEFSQIKKLS
jgi:transcription termination/antitermination factor nusG